MIDSLIICVRLTQMNRTRGVSQPATESTRPNPPHLLHMSPVRLSPLIQVEERERKRDQRENGQRLFDADPIRHRGSPRALQLSL